MKTALKILCFFILFCTTFFCQSENTSSPALPIDSIKIKTNPLLEFNNKFQEFEFQMQLNNLKYNISLDKDPHTIWLRTNMLLSHSPANPSQSDQLPNDLLSPLYQQYLRESDLSVIQYVLGIAQASAVGYLAYLHLKKYKYLY